MSPELLNSAFHNAGVGMGIVGMDSRWLKVNPAILQILGYSREEFLQQTFLSMTHPEDLAKILTAMEAVSKQPHSTQLETRYLHKDGRTIHGLLTVSLVHSPKGEPGYFIVQIQDITARKNVEEELRLANAMLKQTLAERDRFREELLTICAWTKKVVMDGKWVSVEDFLEEKFGIRTSHGICDEAVVAVKQQLQTNNR